MWTEDNSRSFIDYGRFFVPAREFQQWTLCRLLPDPGRPFHLLELCCGEGLLAADLLERFPQCTVHGLDGSAEMLKAAATLLARYGERFQPALFDLAAAAWRQPAFPVDTVVSSLAIHHLDGAQKFTLFGDVFRMLSPGGAFLVADLVMPESPQGMAYAGEALDEVVRHRSVRLGGNLKAYDVFVNELWNFFRYPDDPLDHPSPLLAQLHWLKQAGFRQVEVFWLLAGHAIFGGIK